MEGIRGGVTRGVVLVVLLGVGLLVCVSVVYGQVTVPPNACFINNISEWAWGYRGASTWSAGGHGGCGSISLKTNNSRFISKPVQLSGASSFSIWTYVSATAPHLYIDVWDHATGVHNQAVCNFTLSSSGSWIQKVCDLSAYGSHKVSLWIRSPDAGTVNVAVSDVSMTNATNVLDIYGPGYGNGTFTTSQIPKTFYVGDLSARTWLWDGGVGNGGLGSFKFENVYSTLFEYSVTYPHVQNGESWNWYFYGDVNQISNSMSIVVLDFGRVGVAGSVETELLNTSSKYDLHSQWTGWTVNPSGWNGNTISLAVGVGGVNTSNGNVVWLDDVCPTSGCRAESAPTPTATGGAATPTYQGFPYGPGTPIPVTFPTLDWGLFPTPIYGVGTPVWSSFYGTPQPVFLTTPIIFPSPIYGPGTAIPVVLATMSATPTFTPVTFATPQLVAGVFPTYDPDPSHHEMKFDGSGSSTFNPFDLVIEDGVIGPIPLNLAAFMGLAGSLSLTIHWFYFSKWIFGGIDLMPSISGLGAVSLFLFLIRNLQKR